MDRVKAHIQRNKKKYIAGTYVVVASVTVLVTRNVVLSRAALNSAGVKVVIRPIALFSRQTIFTIIQVDRQGPLSWIIRCLETGEEFMSQRAASAAKGISQSELSKHLSGGLDQVGGLHFERVGLAG